MNKKNLALLTVTAGTMLANSCSAKKEVEKNTEKPNVLVILVDDFGWRDLSCYGSSFYETPNIDRLAAQGVRFTNGYANCPVCSPTRASLQTGKYPNRTGITDWIRGREHSTPNDRWLTAPNTYDLALSDTTIGEVMKENGYKTFFAGKWHLGEDSAHWPEHQGYNINIGGWSKGSPNKNEKKGYDGYFAPYGNPRLEDGPPGEYLPERLTNETIKFIKKNKNSPFFICLCYYLVHIPLQGKDNLIKKYMDKRKKMGIDTIKEFAEDPNWAKYATGYGNYRDRIVQGNPIYASMVQSLDDNVGRILDLLRYTGLDENTVIIFTSDNGGLANAEGSPTSNLPLRGGKGWLTEGGIREPYIFKYPGLKKPGYVNDMPIMTMDIFPTILAFAQIDLKPYNSLDGINLLPYLEGDKYIDRELFWHYPHYSNQGGDPGSVVRYGDYKLFYDIETGKYELYNLNTDIGESHDMSKEKPDMTAKLRKILNEWKTGIHAKKMLPNPDWNGIDKVNIIK
jgi:arylsulfatase A-like enzyme